MTVPRGSVSESASVGGHEARFVEVSGQPTRYYDVGSGEPMLLCHGGWFGQSSANIWTLNMEGLAERFRVLAADELSSGMTFDLDDPFGDVIEARVAHTVEFVRTLGLERVHLVGQSFGGYMATRVALELPEVAATLVVVDSATLAPEIPEESTENRHQRFERNLPKQDPRDYVRAAYQRLSFSLEHVTDELVEAQVWMQQLPEAVEQRRRWADGGRQRFIDSLQRQKRDTLDRISDGGLQLPVLLHWGANDTTALLAQGQRLFDLVAAANPRTRMHVLNQAGHFHFREYPDEFNRNVANFVANW